MWVFVPFNFPFTRWTIYCILERLSHFPFIVSGQFDICKLKTMWWNYRPQTLICSSENLIIWTPSCQQRNISCFSLRYASKERSIKRKCVQAAYKLVGDKEALCLLPSSCDEQLKYLISMSWYRHEDEIMLLDSFKAIEYMCCVYKKKERREKEKPEKTRIAQQQR